MRPRALVRMPSATGAARELRPPAHDAALAHGTRPHRRQLRLDADDPGVRRRPLTATQIAGGQAAAADGHDDGQAARRAASSSASCSTISSPTVPWPATMRGVVERGHEGHA